MMGRLNNKKGSMSTLIMTIFISLVIAVSSFVNASGYQVSRSYAKASFDLAGRSILAEYLSPLQKCYGLFAFKGDDDRIKERLYRYAQESFSLGTPDRSEKAVDALRLNVDSVDLTLREFSLLEIDTFEGQILEQMKYRVFIQNENSLESIAEELSQGALLLELVNKTTAIYQKMTEIDHYISRVMAAHEKISQLEGQMKELLFREYDNTLALAAASQKLVDLAFETRKNDEVIIFEISRMRNFSNDLLTLLNDFDYFMRINQKALNGDIGADILKKVASAKALIAGLNEQDGGSYIKAIENNIKLLKDFENRTDHTALVLSNLERNYNWAVDLSLLNAFTTTSKENLSKKEHFKTILKTADQAIENSKAAEATRILRNQKIIEALPSSMLKESEWHAVLALDLKSLTTIRRILLDGMTTIQVNNYILHYMSNNQSQLKDSRFFQNEVEYILYGSKNDALNYESFKTNFIAFRIGLNLAHIYSSAVKRGQVAALANGITPGPWSLCTELIIATAWASVEAVNDLKLLEAGKKIALLKSEKNWAIDFDALLSGAFEKTLIPLDSDKGLHYSDYLQLFLLFESREIKLLRSLDIIQINMIGNYSEHFSIKDYYCGFRYHAFVSKRSILPDISLFQLDSIEISGLQLY